MDGAILGTVDASERWSLTSDSEEVDTVRPGASFPGTYDDDIFDCETDCVCCPGTGVEEGERVAIASG